MLISKSDLYKGEWLELVFKNRNHNYGAYQLRQTHENVMTRTVSALFITAALFGTVVTVIAHSRPMVEKPPLERIIDVPIPKEKVYDAVKPKELPKPKVAPAAAPKNSAVVPTQVFVTPKPVEDHLAEEIKELDQNKAVGSVEVNGPSTGAVNASPAGEGDPNAKGTGTGDEDANGVRDFATVEVMPEPVGGMGAWNKFLEKNIRYPRIAQENNISGKSFVSFIIEKDGSLSNINIIRKGGNGFDEEAMRVLKLAKAWKPGLQNGQAVRVRYVIPINFQLEEQ